MKDEGEKQKYEGIGSRRKLRFLNIEPLNIEYRILK